MKRTSAQNTKLGIFVILGSLVFAAAIYFIGSTQNRFGKTATLYATFKHVNGLQPGNNVRFSGIDVGTVRKIDMINDSTIVVNMVMEISIMRHIDKSAVATISSDGLVGSMIINITPGNGGPTVKDGDYIASYSRISTDELLSTLNVTNENAALLTSELLIIARQVKQGKGSIGTLLNDTLMAVNMQNTLRNLSESTAKTSQMITNLNTLLYSIDKRNNLVGVIKDTAVATQVKKIIGNLERSSVAIDSMAENINTVSERLKNGKGAVDLVSNNTEFATNLDSLVINLNMATKILQEDLEAAQHSFLLKGYFKKKQKETAKKAK